MDGGAAAAATDTGGAVGGVPGARSDLYSVGVVLYHMLTGRVPFDAETPLGIVLKQVADDPAPPSSVFPGVHPHLEAICLKALRKKASERYQGAREMRLALRVAMGVTMRGTSAEPRAAASSPPQLLADTQPLP